MIEHSRTPLRKRAIRIGLLAASLVALAACAALPRQPADGPGGPADRDQLAAAPEIAAWSMH